MYKINKTPKRPRRRGSNSSKETTPESVKLKKVKEMSGDEMYESVSDGGEDVSNNETEVSKVFKNLKESLTNTLSKTIDEELKKAESKFLEAIRKTNERVEKVERNDKKNNAIIFGIQEPEREKVEDVEKEIEKICQRMGIPTVDFDFAVRIGAAKKGVNRPILIRFVRAREKREFMEKARNALRGTNIFINNDLTMEQREAGKKLRDFRNDFISKNPALKDRVKIKQSQVILLNPNGVNNILFPPRNSTIPGTSQKSAPRVHSSK